MELEAVVEASRTGDKQAFGRIVSAYQGLVCSVAYSLTGDLQRSEDIAQEAFLAAWQRLRAGQLPEIETYAFGLIPVALYRGIGLALFPVLRKQEALQQRDVDRQ